MYRQTEQTRIQCIQVTVIPVNNKYFRRGSPENVSQYCTCGRLDYGRVCT